MNQYVTGTVIKELREKKKLTQSELAEKLTVSNKAVSKWETGKGYPDITLLEPLSKALGVSITEILAGETIVNANVSANILRSKFYVCPICGNVIYSIGESVIHCHGVQLTPAVAEPSDENHMPAIEIVEDELFVKIEHEMTKEHYISFIAAVSPDRVQIVKLYPEGNAETRFKNNSVSKLYFYCNHDGLLYTNSNR